MIKHLISLILVFLLAPFVLADYHYASHTGSNEYPYTSWATAADSIQHAVDACSPHDTIYIGPGVWEQNIITYEDDSVAIIGMGIDSTIISVVPSTLEGIRLDYNCSVQNLTVRRPQGGPGVNGMPYAGIRVANCKIRATVGVTCWAYPTYISNCIMDSCSEGINVYSGSYLEITNNVLTDMRGSVAGIELYTHAALVENNIIYCSPGATLQGLQGDRVYTDRIIRNNLVWNGIHSIGIGALTKHNNSVTGSDYGLSINPQESLKNNSVSYTWAGMQDRDSSMISYNCFWRNTIDIQSLGANSETTGNIFANPMYISNRDFHLQLFSPLIDAGDPTILDTDSSRSDIGAYGGPYGSSYAYQDLAPRTPDTIRGNYNQDTAFIGWTVNTEADFNRYLLYRDTVGGFIPSTANLIAQPETSIYLDLGVSNLHYYYYRVAAVDNQDNVSGYSSELVVITTDIWNQPGAELPQVTAISSNYPNPFNVSTVVMYRVANLGPQPAEIKIDIYDVVGRRVRTLVNERKEAGQHRISWDGKDNAGGQLSSGVYFARISQWGLELSGKPRKLMLIK